MTETLNFGESLLRFITIPHPNSLWCIKAKINTQEKRDNSARSAYHWQLLKCRLLIFTLYNIIACPAVQTLFEIFVIISKEDFEHGRLQTLLEKFDMKPEGPTAVRPEIYEICLRYTICSKMAPHWNPIGSESLAKGRDFLISKSFGTVQIEYKVAGTTLTLSLRSSYVQLPRMTMSYLGFSAEMLNRAWANGNSITDMDLTGQWVYVLPSLRKGRLMAIWNTIPPSCPYKSYKEIRRHWKNAYGYRLPEDETNMLFFEVYFRPLGSTFFTYPDVCVRPYFPRRCRSDIGTTEDDLLENLLTDMNKIIKNICGSPFITLPEQARVTMDILPATVIENDSGANLQLGTINKYNHTLINNVKYSQHASANTNLISLCTPSQNNISACDLYDLPSTYKENHQAHNIPISQILNENTQLTHPIKENGANNKKKIKPQFNPKKQIIPVFIPFSVPSKTQEAKVLPYVPMFNKNKTFYDEIFNMDSKSDESNIGSELKDCFRQVDTGNNSGKCLDSNRPGAEKTVPKFSPMFNTNKNKVIGIDNSEKNEKQTSFKKIVPVVNNISLQKLDNTVEGHEEKLAPNQVSNKVKPARKPKSEAPVLFTENLLSGTQKLETATVASLQNWLKSQGIQVKSKSRKPELIEKSLEILQNLRTRPSTNINK